MSCTAHLHVKLKQATFALSLLLWARQESHALPLLHINVLLYSRSPHSATMLRWFEHNALSSLRSGGARGVDNELSPLQAAHARQHARKAAWALRMNAGAMNGASSARRCNVDADDDDDDSDAMDGIGIVRVAGQEEGHTRSYGSIAGSHGRRHRPMLGVRTSTARDLGVSLNVPNATCGPKLVSQVTCVLIVVMVLTVALARAAISRAETLHDWQQKQALSSHSNRLRIEQEMARNNTRIAGSRVHAPTRLSRPQYKLPAAAQNTSHRNSTNQPMEWPALSRDPP